MKSCFVVLGKDKVAICFPSAHVLFPPNSLHPTHAVASAASPSSVPPSAAGAAAADATTRSPSPPPPPPPTHPNTSSKPSLTSLPWPLYNLTFADSYFPEEMLTSICKPSLRSTTTADSSFLAALPRCISSVLRRLWPWSRFPFSAFWPNWFLGFRRGVVTRLTIGLLWCGGTGVSAEKRWLLRWARRAIRIRYRPRFGTLSSAPRRIRFGFKENCPNGGLPLSMPTAMFLTRVNRRNTRERLTEWFEVCFLFLLIYLFIFLGKEA